MIKLFSRFIKFLGFQLPMSPPVEPPISHYCVGENFAVRLGPRKISDGSASGEEFRNIIINLLDVHERIQIDFTKCKGGCSAAWFHEAFGKLIGHGYTPKELFERIEILTSEPSDILLIGDYISPDIHRNHYHLYREIGVFLFKSNW